jgi:hypothetical protein
MQVGYVPASVGRSVSHTTEYAHDDFALANLAEQLGDTATAATLRARSRGWRMLFDPAVGFLRARNADGSFPSGSFDPLELSDDYAEANAWHSLWMAGVHDPDGLAELFGGRAGAIAKLETFFTESRRDWEEGDASAANFPRPYYWHGNEPDLNAAFLFAQLGRPDLTHEWARWILDHHYNDTPTGVAGNDDGGTLGSWYVLAALGLYPVAGSADYVDRHADVRARAGGRRRPRARHRRARRLERAPLRRRRRPRRRGHHHAAPDPGRSAPGLAPHLHHDRHPDDLGPVITACGGQGRRRTAGPCRAARRPGAAARRGCRPG